MEFSLFAPHVEWVEVVGSWSDDGTPMERGDDEYWRTDIDLPDGRHTYRYRLPSLSHFKQGEIVEVTDPRARMVDEWNGDATMIVIEAGRDVTTDPDFAWQHDDVPLPPDHELIIYELHVGEFGWKDDQQGTFDTAIERLDYLHDLGVTAVEVMPVMAFPGDSSWGYNVRHAFALENAYGDPSAFKRFVDACHGRGIRVILDLVLNHSESEAPLTQIDFHYWYRDAREGELSFGAAFDFERHDDTLDVMPAHKYAVEMAAFWVQEYHIDGYRLDATAVLDNFEVVGAVRQTSKELAGGKPFYVVAEQLPEDPAIAGPDGPADGAWHQQFEGAVVGWLAEEEGASTEDVLAALDPANSGYAAPALVVNYLESHDEHTLLQVLAEKQITGEAAFRRHKLGASLMFTAVGIPMLYQGQEFGGYRERDLEIRPLQWELLDNDFGLHLKEHYAFLAQTRRGSPALTGAEFETLHHDEEANVIAFQRGFGEAEIIAVANLRDSDQDISIPFPDGTWRELSLGYDLDVSDGTLSEPFPASTLKLFARRE